MMWYHFTFTELTTLKNCMSHYGSISKVCLLLLAKTETIHLFKEITSKVTRIERDTWTPMFTAALFTTARTWKQPRCPLAGKWIRQLYVVHIHNGILLRLNTHTHIWVVLTLREELTHWKRLWCWEGLGAGGEGDDRGWDGWMASLTRCTWVWVNSRSCWWTGRPGVLRFMGSQRVRHDWATELNWMKWINLEPNIRSEIS